MNFDTLKLRSSVKSSLFRYVLFKGTLLGALGALILLIGGIALPKDILSTWGFPLFCLGIGLIAWGLIPFRALKQLELNPDVLTLENEQIHYFAKNKCLFSVPFSAIKETVYIDENRQYGIGIQLNHPLSDKIIVRSSKYEMQKFCRRSQKEHDCDLFFAYFSLRSYQELREYLSHLG